MTQTTFEHELEIFRTEEETAQQCFFCYLSIRDLAGRDADVIRIMNVTPLFWVTAHHTMLLATFVILGRIFDQKSQHNIDTLISATSRNIEIFSMKALAARKEAAGLSKPDAAAYVVDKHALNADDVRTLRRQIAHWRRVYETRYRVIRHKVFAHKGLSNISEVNALLAKTQD
jgi:hypothetical protein